MQLLDLWALMALNCGGEKIAAHPPALINQDTSSSSPSSPPSALSLLYDSHLSPSIIPYQSRESRVEQCSAVQWAKE